MMVIAMANYLDEKYADQLYNKCHAKASEIEFLFSAETSFPIVAVVQ